MFNTEPLYLKEVNELCDELLNGEISKKSTSELLNIAVKSQEYRLKILKRKIEIATITNQILGK